jgi:hypothetical protein
MVARTPTRSWLVTVLVLVGLAAALTVSMTLAAPRFRIVTRSFHGGAIAFTGTGTGPANPYPSQISVTSFKRGSWIIDVNLKLRGFTSNNPDDVAVMLAHGQTNQGVMSDTGGSVAVANITFTLDDQAALPLPDAAQILTGTSYKPARYGADWPAPAPSALAVFKGEHPNGAWRLFVVDDGFGAQSAEFLGWTVTIKARVPR